MARYIDAEALINELEAGCMPIYESGISGILGDKDCIRDYIERAPAADVQEVKHGRWEKHETHSGAFEFWFCSECDRSGGYSINPGFNYCPNCGAKMDGKDGEK